MEREAMIKRMWRPYMMLEYKTPGMKNPIEVILKGINFEDEVLIVAPLDLNLYHDEDKSVCLKYIEIPKPKLKKIK